jgi:hypothetical protein
MSITVAYLCEWRWFDCCTSLEAGVFLKMGLRCPTVSSRWRCTTTPSIVSDATSLKLVTTTVNVCQMCSKSTQSCGNCVGISTANVCRESTGDQFFCKIWASDSTSWVQDSTCRGLWKWRPCPCFYQLPSLKLVRIEPCSPSSIVSWWFVNISLCWRVCFHDPWLRGMCCAH